MKRVSLCLVTSFMSLFAPPVFATPTCAEINDSPEGFYSYFQTVNEEGPSDPALASDLLRKSYAAFYGNVSKKVSDEELNERGEGIYFATVKDPEGRLYTTVSVGFGGGNQAVYYYAPNSKKLQPFFSYDGDCMNAGDVAELPIEKQVKDVATTVVTCEVSSEKSPIANLNIELKTAEGTLVSDKAVVKLTASASADGVSTKSLSDSGLHFFAGDHQNSKSLSVGGIVKSKSRKLIQFTVAINKKQPKITGRVYPNQSGGYWAPEAYDFEGYLKCQGLEAIKDAKYSRIIRYK